MPAVILMQAMRLSAVVVGSSLVAVWAAGSAGACLARSSQSAPPASVQKLPSSRPGPIAVGRGVEVGRLEPRIRPPLSPTRRNLFRERERAAVSVSEPAPSPAAPSTAAEPALPPGPRLALAGIAEQLDADRLVRTAVVSGAGDLWLVREGSLLAGRYRVERIAVDTVYLVDTLGGPDRVLRMR